MLLVFGRRWRSSLCGCAALFCASVADPTQGQTPSSVERQYAANGDLLFPNGFETWIFVGSDLGLSYRSDLPVTTLAESARVDTVLS